MKITFSEPTSGVDLLEFCQKDNIYKHPDKAINIVTEKGKRLFVPYSETKDYVPILKRYISVEWGLVTGVLFYILAADDLKINQMFIGKDLQHTVGHRYRNNFILPIDDAEILEHKFYIYGCAPKKMLASGGNIPIIIAKSDPIKFPYIENRDSDGNLKKHILSEETDPESIVRYSIYCWSDSELTQIDEDK